VNLGSVGFGLWFAWVFGANVRDKLLSRCSSKLRIISLKDLPVGGPEELNNQVHSEQPQP
jgi:hypothetical protein